MNRFVTFICFFNVIIYHNLYFWIIIFAIAGILYAFKKKILVNFFNENNFL